MKRDSTITLIRVAILATAMGCGGLGVKWYRDRSEFAARELLDLADSTTLELAKADELEQRLLAEGRVEETYKAYDIRRNAQRDWFDIQAQLRTYLGFSNRRRLLKYDLLTEPEAIRAGTEAVRQHLGDRTDAYVLLGTSTFLLLLTLFIKPSAPKADADPSTEP